MALDTAVRGQFVRVNGDSRPFVVMGVEAPRVLVAPVDEAWWKGLGIVVKSGQFLRVEGHEGLFVALHAAEVEIGSGGVAHEAKGVVVAPVGPDAAAWRGLEDLKPHEGAWRWSHYEPAP